MLDIRRRQFITLLGGAAVAWPLAGRAQQGERVRRIGILTGLNEGDRLDSARDAVFRDTLTKLGWTPGRNIWIDYRWGAISIERGRSLAAELLRLSPSVLLTQSSLALRAAMLETRTVPIVFVNAADPVSSGLISGTAHPGGNATGFTNAEFSIGEKWLDILKQMAPTTSRVLVLLDSGNVGTLGFLRTIEAVSPSMGVRLSRNETPDIVSIERAINELSREPNGGVIALPSPPTVGNRERIVALVAIHRLPAIYPTRLFVTSGGLMSYGTEDRDLYRRAASYVDRILRGEKPADLPVQAPTKYELVINLKTAKALGLTVPPTLLALADEVIE
jgi:putative ABC transport system substrate-binding protein